jgi:hypothetical protein
MTDYRISLLRALSAFFFSALSNAQPAQDTNGFRPPALNEMYSSHEGQPITEIGLTQGELKYVLSIVRRNVMVVNEKLKSTSVLERELLARRVDMGQGVTNGLVVQGSKDLCGDGNCITWFFRRSHAKWQPLFFVTSNFSEFSVGMFAFLPPKHSGLFNLLLMTHMSADDAPTDIWQFNGVKYELVESYCTHSSGAAVMGKCP